jgi:hypothetical protein
MFWNCHTWHSCCAKFRTKILEIFSMRYINMFGPPPPSGLIVCYSFRLFYFAVCDLNFSPSYSLVENSQIRSSNDHDIGSCYKLWQTHSEMVKRYLDNTWMSDLHIKFHANRSTDSIIQVRDTLICRCYRLVLKAKLFLCWIKHQTTWERYELEA